MEQVVAIARLESLDSGPGQFPRSFGKLEALLKQAKEAPVPDPGSFCTHWSCTEPGCNLHALERRPPSPHKQHCPSLRPRCCLRPQREAGIGCSEWSAASPPLKCVGLAAPKHQASVSSARANLNAVERALPSARAARQHATGVVFPTSRCWTICRSFRSLVTRREQSPTPR